MSARDPLLALARDPAAVEAARLRILAARRVPMFNDADAADLFGPCDLRELAAEHRAATVTIARILERARAEVRT